jgi:hypothetical protein
MRAGAHAAGIQASRFSWVERNVCNKLLTKNQQKREAGNEALQRPDTAAADPVCVAVREERQSRVRRRATRRP